MGGYSEKMSMNYFFDKDIEAFDLSDKSKRKTIAHGKNLTTCHLYFEAGGIGEPHKHPQTQVAIILSGRFEFTLNGDTVLLSSGDSVYIPGNAEHSLVCLEKGELIDVFTPEREDLI